MARLVYGASSSPEEQLYKKIQGKWKSVLEEGIDYKKFGTFDWEEAKGTFLKEQAWEVLLFYKACIECSVFPREDYRELCTLVVVFLSVPQCIEKFLFKHLELFPMQDS